MQETKKILISFWWNLFSLLLLFRFPLAEVIIVVKLIHVAGADSSALFVFLFQNLVVKTKNFLV